MKLSLEIDRIYQLLCNPPVPVGTDLDQDGNFVVQGRCSNNPIGCGFQSPGGGARLLQPFKKVLVSVNRQGMAYWGGIAFVSEVDAFSESAEWIEKIAPGLAKEYGTRFFENSAGCYLLNDSREPVIAVDAGGKALTVFVGAEGTRTRGLADRDSFYIDMKCMERVANKILDFGIRDNTNKDITLYLGI